MHSLTRLILLLTLMTFLGSWVPGCETEIVELLPPGERGGERGPAEAGPHEGSPEAAPDRGADKKPACVCRFINCRNSTDCQYWIGASSTCSGKICSGGRGSCSKSHDCAQDGGLASDWSCTVSATSLTICPP